MAQLPWTLVAVFATTGILMGQVSCLVGMRPKVENPAWWGLYVVWMVVVFLLEPAAPFLTILVASGLAGLLHGATTGLLLNQYREHNPWHAERAKGPRVRVAAQFVAMGAVIGTARWWAASLRLSAFSDGRSARGTTRHSASTLRCNTG